MTLAQQHVDKVESDFPASQHARIYAELARLDTTHTWDSEYNLNNAIGAILSLSHGDVSELVKLVDAARTDFRDVIYWWFLEQKKQED